MMKESIDSMSGSIKKSRLFIFKQETKTLKNRNIPLYSKLMAKYNSEDKYLPDLQQNFEGSFSRFFANFMNI